MIIVKFQDKHGQFWPLSNVRNVKMSLFNKNNRLNSIESHGWKNSLEQSGEKHMVVKIIGIGCSSRSEEVIREFAMENRAIGCQISISNKTKEKIDAKFLIELYERNCEAGNMENFTVELISSGEVVHDTV